MLRYLLAFFFFVMLAGHEFGFNVNLGPGLSLKNALLYLMVIGVAINTAVARNRQIEAASVFVPFAILIGYAILTWLITVFLLERPAYPPRATLISLKSSLVDHFLTLAIFFYGAINRKDALWLLKALIAIVMVTNVITLVDSLNMPNLGILDARGRDGRFLGFMGAANDYGMLLTLFLPLAIAWAWCATGVSRLFVALGALVTVGCLVLTVSRGAYVGLIAGGMVAVWLLRREISGQIVMRSLGFIMLGVIVITPFLYWTGYLELLATRIGLLEGNLQTASSGRTRFWAETLRAMTEVPTSFITGFGFEAFEFSRQFGAATHNHYLNILYNLGFIGVALFLMVFGATTNILKRAAEMAGDQAKVLLIGAIFGVLALLVTQVFGQYYRSAYLLWACLGAALRLAIEASDVRSSGEEGVAAPEIRRQRASVAQPQLRRSESG